MKKIVLLSSIFCALISFTSCATFVNDNYKQITVSSNIKDAKIIINDSLYTSPASIIVKRDNKALKFTLKSDSLALSKDYLIKSKISGIFFSGNIPMVVGAPFGIITDLTNKKRFDYPKIIELNHFDESLSPLDLKIAKKKYRRENWDFIEDTAQEFRKEERRNAFERNKLRTKGDIVHNYILPGFNYFLINPEGPKFNTGGVLKIGYGMDYFYKNSTFFNADFIVKSNLIDPLISAAFLETRILNPELSFTNNHRFNRFEIGYGVSFQYFYYYFENDCYDCDYSMPGPNWTPSQPTIDKINEGYFTISPKIKTAYQLNRKLYVGLFYQPSVIKFASTSNNTKTDHIFGVDFRFKAKAASKR